MTTEICSHHYYSMIWIIIEIALVVFTTCSGSVYASHNWTSPPLNIPTDQYMAWDGGVMGFYFGIFGIIASNLFALYMLNGRYEWIRIKECPRN